MGKETARGISDRILYLTHQEEILKKELMVQSEQLSREILERKAEVDRLKIEIQSLKRLLEQRQPGTLLQYEKIYDEECRKFDPEIEKSAS